MNKPQANQRFSFVFFLGFGACLFAFALEPGDFVAQGPPNSKRISLTFDDGPGPNTEKFLELLRRHGVKGTFFVLGEQARIRPLATKHIAEEGHEIGSHTMTHMNYLKRQKELLKKAGGDENNKELAVVEVRQELIDDMNKSRDIIEKITGTRLYLLRMPHGIDRPWVKQAAKSAGFILVNWTYGADWVASPNDSVDDLRKSYTQAIKPGAILLIHDGWPQSDKSLAVTEVIIKTARAKGYEVVPVGELIGLKTN